MKEKISITLDKKAIDKVDSIIDNIYIRSRSQAIEHLINQSVGENKIAVILAGGPENNLSISPNEYRITAKIQNTTVIESAVKKLRENGFKQIYIIARHKILTSIFDIIKDGSKYGVAINYIEETSASGTADSLRLMKGKVKESFLVVYGDLVFNNIDLNELWNNHLLSKPVSTLMLTTSAKPSEKGTVKLQGNKILEFTQKPKTSDVYIVFSPIFICEPELFEYSGSSLENDVLPLLATKGLLNGYVSSEKEYHVHSKSDAENIK